MANHRFITCFKQGVWKWVGWLLLVNMAACGIAEQPTANQPVRVPSPTQELPAETAANTASGSAAPTAAPATTSATVKGNGMDESIHEDTPTSIAPAPTPASPQPAKLESLLFQSGDLPGTIIGEPVDDPTPPNFTNDPPVTTIVGQRLTRDGRTVGNVSLLFHANPSDLAQVYQRLTENADPFTTQPSAMEPRTDVGDKAVTGRLTLVSSTYGPTNTMVVIFARCHAIIDIRLNEQPDLTLDTALAYAKRVDQRIEAVVCQ